MRLRQLPGRTILVAAVAWLPRGLERPYRSLRPASDRGPGDPAANVAQRGVARARPLRTVDALARRGGRARRARRGALRAKGGAQSYRARTSAAAIPGHLRPARRAVDLHHQRG